MCKDYKIVMCRYGRYVGYEHSLFFNYNSYLIRFVTSSLNVIDGRQKAHHKLIKVETNASACLKVGQGIPTKIISKLLLSTQMSKSMLALTKSKTFRQAVFPRQLTRLDFWPSLPCLPPGLLAWWKISKDNRKIWQSTMNYGPMGISPHFQHPHALEAVEKATCVGQAVKKCKKMLNYLFFYIFCYFNLM